MIRFGLPVSATTEGKDDEYFHKDISGFIEAGPRISATESMQINRQQGPKGFVLPIIVACAEATPVILSLSPIQLPSTKSM